MPIKKIALLKGGPMLVFGVSKIDDIPLADASSSDPPLALCRCGCSNDKPFCDGAHKECEVDLPNGSIE